MFTEYIQDKYMKLFKIYIKLNTYIILRDSYMYSNVKDKLEFRFTFIKYDLDYFDVIKIETKWLIFNCYKSFE